MSAPKSFLQAARQFWHRHDVGVNAFLGISAAVGAFAGYKATKDADLGSVPATVALKTASTTLGALATPMITAACVGYPPMILAPLAVGVIYGIDSSNAFKAQQTAVSNKQTPSNER